MPKPVKSSVEVREGSRALPDGIHLYFPDCKTNRLRSYLSSTAPLMYILILMESIGRE